MAERFTVMLDACVLYPAPLRDLLMQLTAADLFRARWSHQIHSEWMRNLLANRPDLKQADLERVRDLMNLHARDSLVSGYETLIELIQNCPDPDDRHVIAAAYHAQADAIVTFNLKDFPAAALAPYGLDVIHPRRLPALSTGPRFGPSAGIGAHLPGAAEEPAQIRGRLSGHPGSPAPAQNGE